MGFWMTSHTCWAQGTQKLQPHPLVCHHPQQCVVTTPFRFYRFGRPSLLEIRRNPANFKVFHLFACSTSLFVKQSRPIQPANDVFCWFLDLSRRCLLVGFVHRCFFRWREPISALSGVPIIWKWKHQPIIWKSQATYTFGHSGFRHKGLKNCCIGTNAAE